MSIKRILAAVSASVVAVSAMAVVASAEGFSGTHTMKDSAWWTQDVIIGGDDDLPLSNLIGDADPADVASITFTSDTTFCVGYNSTEGWYQVDTNALETSYTFDNIKLETTTNDKGEEEKPYLHIAISKGDDVEYTINWTVNLKDGGDATESKTEESKTEESKTEESKTEESKTEESKTEESKTEESKTDEKPNVDTGVEGVAAVVGVAAVAAGALVVAKKRK